MRLNGFSQYTQTKLFSEPAEGQWHPGVHREEHCHHKERSDPAPLSPGRASPGVICAAPQYKADIPGVSPVEEKKMIKGLKNLSYEERMRDLGLFSLAKRKLRGDLIKVCQCL